jgi:hypothetical protein
MANFDTFTAKMEAVQQASMIVPLLRNMYQSAAQLRAFRALYVAGTNPVFNQAVDALHSTAEFTEIAAMITQTTSLATDWETNHAGALTAR